MANPAQITLTLTGLPDDIEVRIRQGSYTLQHNQNVSGEQETYTYSYVQDELVTISFGGAGIIEAKTIQLLLGNADQTALITFNNDPSYGGPIPFSVVFSGEVDIYDTSAHEITMTFTQPPKTGTMTTANITQITEDNGTISNIAVTGDTSVWTFDYTADANVTDLTNKFNASTSILTNSDDSPLAAETQSSNFYITNATFGVTFSGVANIIDTNAHTITMTFTRVPLASTMTTTNITQEVENNGTISNIGVTTNALVWEFDYTLDEAITDTTNYYRANTSITDLNDVALASNVDSSNFEIDVVVSSIIYDMSTFNTE